MKVRLSVFISRLFMASGPKAYYRTGQVLRKLSLLFCCLILFCPLVLPQEISGTYTVDRNEAQVNHLLRLLNQEKMQEALEYFYGKSVVYDRELTDLLVFIDKTKRGEKPPAPGQCLENDNSVKFALLRRGKKRTDLFGQKFVYLIVFVAENADDNASVGNSIVIKETSKSTETKIVNKSGPEEKEEKEVTIDVIKKIDRLSVHQSSLDYQVGTGEFFLLSMIKSMLKAFPGGAAIDGSEKKDVIKEIPDEPLKMGLVGCIEGKTKLFFVKKRLTLVENTINRFTVVEKETEKKSYNHLATFGNYCSSNVGSSIGFMGTFLTSKQQEEFGDKRRPINAFLLGHLYLKRPRLPTPHLLDNTLLHRLTKRCSLSVVFGTAIKEKLFDDLFVGIGVGHLLSNNGFVAGLNFRTPPTPAGSKTEKRRSHFCIGVSFAL